MPPPVMPSVVRIWQGVVPIPPITPPDVTTDAQVRPWRFQNLDSSAFIPSPVSIYLPPRVDIRGSVDSINASTVEIPTGSGMFFKCFGVVDWHRDTPDEYRVADCEPLTFIAPYG